jgi:hypothetical protein
MCSSTACARELTTVIASKLWETETRARPLRRTFERDSEGAYHTLTRATKSKRSPRRVPDLIGRFRSGERFWDEHESFSHRGSVEAAVPGGEQEVLSGEHESGGEV